MDLFLKLSKIKDYFIEIKKLEESFFSISFHIPSKWEIKNHPSNFELFDFPVKDRDIKGINFVGSIEFLDDMFKHMELIVAQNIEKERKDILLKNTINALANIFDENSLEKLKTLKFYFDEGSGKSNKQGASNVRKGDKTIKEPVGSPEESVSGSDVESEEGGII